LDVMIRELLIAKADDLEEKIGATLVEGRKPSSSR